ncbi:MAG TPA: PAS domain S-box protein [Steroidobacteraceae bacterium]|nr:PAS domain S-box protein [Steroidobacteraceae bacterium]
MPTPLNVLLVGDDSADADLLLAELRRAGFDPKWKRIESEPDFLAELKNAPDIVLAAYSLPRFSGLRVAELLQASAWNIPFILISAAAGEELAVEAMQRGAADYLLKDGIGRLGSAVERALAEKQKRAERLQAEENLRASERHYRELLENAHEMIQTISADGRIVYVNPAWRQVLGYSGDEAARLNFIDIVHPQSRSKCQELFRQLMTEQRAAQVDAQFVTKAGRTLSVEGTVNCQVLAGEQAVARCFFRDVTERKRAEVNFVRLAAIVESSDDAIIGKDLDGIVNSWNKGAEKIFGYSAAEMLGTSILRLIPAERHAEETQILEQIKRGHSVEHLETLRITKDGRRIHVSVTSSPIQDHTGKIIGVSKVSRDITARKRVEEDLRSSHAQLEQMTTHSAAVIYQLRMAGQNVVPIGVSANITAILGFTQAETLSYEWWLAALHPDDRELAIASIANTLRQGTNRTEYRIRHKQGGYRWIEDNRRVILDGAGQPLEIIGVWMDVTERKQAELRIRQLSQAVEQSPVSIVITDSQGRIEYVNARLCELTGYAAADLNGQNPRLWKSGETLPGKYRDLWATISAGNIWYGEFHNRKKNGDLYWESASVAPITDAAGRITHFLAVKEDITERKRLEQEARWRTTLMEAQLNSSLDGILMLDEQGRKILDNQRFNDIHKMPAAIAGSNVTEQRLNFVAGQVKDPKRFLQRLAHLNAHPEEVSRDEIEMLDGTILDRYSSPVRDKAGKYYGRIFAFRDITQHRKLEQQFHQAQKMESIGQLAGGIAHDFNNILGAIIGYTDLARAQLADDGFGAQCLDEIAKASGRATDLVRQILTFSRQQEHERKPTRLDEAVVEALKLLRASVPTAVEFNTSLSEVPPVLADPTAIHQIVMNLGTNAWYAMKARPGTLTVELAAMDLSADFAAGHADLKPGSYVRLTVGDTGTGMDAATLNRIFDPFFTTKPVGEGTGLGLAVVHGIMKSHEGSITVYSQVGEGTVFHLYFPALAAAKAAPARKSDAVPQGSGARILFVDDEEPLAWLGKRMLERLGYVVTVQTNPLHALAAFREQPGEFDLVLTDFTMPNASGTSLAAQLLELQPGLPIILLSGYRGVMTEEKVKELGFRELLLKPYTIRSLGESVYRVLHPPHPAQPSQPQA